MTAAGRSFSSGRRRRSKPAPPRRAGASAWHKPRATASGFSPARAGICSSNAAATDVLGNGRWSTTMSRIVSVWLPRWPITRFLAAQALAPTNKPVDPERPFVLVVAASGGLHIAALNAAAEAQGLAVGELLADARAKAVKGFRCTRSMPRPTMPRCAASLCGRRATRRPPRPGAGISGTTRTAPTVSSSTSKARRICSAARTN